MLNLLEVAIYAIVIAGQPQQLPVSFRCVPDGIDGVNCTNGMAATPEGVHDIRFRNGVVVVKGDRGRLTFTNGITSHMDSAGWVKFSNGISARRDRLGGFRLAIYKGVSGEGDYEAEFYCRQTEPEIAQCDRTK